MDNPALALGDLTLGPGERRVAIAVPDLTRGVDTPRALRALREHLGGEPEVTVVVGLGLHRPLRPEELAPYAQACGWTVLNHDPDRCVNLGEEDGVPALVHPSIAEADRVLALGVVELHQYAGFSGGHKAVAVGCGGRATLDALHARDRVCDPRVQIGDLRSPFRQVVDALGRRARCSFALQSVGGRWVGGPPEQALAVAARALDPWEPVSRRVSELVLQVPRSKAVNFYQASRAATYMALSPHPPLEPGGLLLLDAACPEGIGEGAGEQAFAELLGQSRPPWQELLTGPAATGAGTQRAWILARMAQRFRLLVTGCERPEALQALGIEATHRPAKDLVGPDALWVPSPFVRLPQYAPPG